MRALIYDPYLDTLGGGERYSLTIAQTLLREGWEVSIIWNNYDILSKASEKFNLSINNLTVVDPSILNEKFLNRWTGLKSFDLLFWVSDGSLPLILGPKKNWVHFQVPFTNVDGRSFANQTKLKMINKLVCNSHFTANVIEREFGRDCEVLYPPIDVDKFPPGTKTNTILYVGRFSQLLQDKGHAQLIAAFKTFLSSCSINYKLVLAGSTESSDQSYLNWLMAEAQGFPIEIITDPTFTQLKSLYAESKLFWGLAGINIDENEHPEKCEHFGMSVVEAMAAGCIPILINKGGYKEIVEDGKSGYLINRIDQLLGVTLSLVNQPNLSMISQKAISRAGYFSETSFSRQLMQML